MQTLSKYQIIGAFFYGYLLLNIVSCCKDEPCTDATNPACDNYDPCIGATQTSAGFKIYDREFSTTPIGWVRQDTDTVSIGAIFEANMPEDNVRYEWRIGSGVYGGRIVEIPDGMPLNTRLSASLIVHNSKVNKTCFPNDDGRDTFTRIYYTSSNAYRMNGIFRGAFDSRPYDSIDFIFHPDSNRVSLPSINCRNYYGYDLVNNGSASILLTSVIPGYKDTSKECFIDSRTQFLLSKDSRTFSLKFLNRPKSKDTLMRGRKIKSI